MGMRLSTCLGSSFAVDKPQRLANQAAALAPAPWQKNDVPAPGRNLSRSAQGSAKPAKKNNAHCRPIPGRAQHSQSPANRLFQCQPPVRPPHRRVQEAGPAPPGNFADSTQKTAFPEDATSAHALGGQGICFHRSHAQEAQDSWQALSCRQGSRVDLLYGADPASRGAHAFACSKHRADARVGAATLETHPATPVVKLGSPALLHFFTSNCPPMQAWQAQEATELIAK